MKAQFKRIKKFLADLKPRPSVNPEARPLASYINPKDLLPKDSLVRLGTPYGGWIIPERSQLNPESICYLAGAGEDISFDCALVNRFNCSVRIMDPTPRAVDHFQRLKESVLAGRKFPVNNSQEEFYELLPPQLEKVTFIPAGLSNRDEQLKFFFPRNPEHVSCSTENLQDTEKYFSAQCYRLSTIMSLQGDRRLDLLKMDIEGAEYSVIRDLIDSNLIPSLLLIEFDEAHTPKDSGAPKRIETHVQMLLNAGMRCVSVDGNNMTLINTKAKS